MQDAGVFITGLNRRVTQGFGGIGIHARSLDAPETPRRTGPRIEPAGERHGPVMAGKAAQLHAVARLGIEGDGLGDRRHRRRTRQDQAGTIEPGASARSRTCATARLLVPSSRAAPSDRSATRSPGPARDHRPARRSCGRYRHRSPRPSIRAAGCDARSSHHRGRSACPSRSAVRPVHDHTSSPARSRHTGHNAASTAHRPSPQPRPVPHRARPAGRSAQPAIASASNPTDSA